MFTSGLSLLSAVCILVFPGVTIADDLFTCNVPRNLTLDLSTNERAHLYESELTVHIEKGSLSTLSSPGLNTIVVQAKNVVVAFKGIMVVEDVNAQIFTQPERISQISVDRISGVVERIHEIFLFSRSMLISKFLKYYAARIMNSWYPQLIAVSNMFDRNTYMCYLYQLVRSLTRFLRQTIKPTVHVRIANEIRRLAESCIELELCQKIGHMSPQEVAASPSENRSGLLALCAEPLTATVPSARSDDSDTSGLTFNHGAVQSAINKLVDIALAEIIEKLKEKNEGTVNVPNIDKQFSTGSGIFETTGRFEAVDGTLRDLTTIRRSTDVTLSHTGMKFLASCGFGLQILDLHYDHYRLKYGIIKVNGKMSASVDGMALEARVAADYTQNPCRMELEQLEVTEMGKIKISLTGLSPLNYLVSKLLGVVSQNWNDDIVHMVEKKLRKKVVARLATFNCERFRP